MHTSQEPIHTSQEIVDTSDQSNNNPVINDSQSSKSTSKISIGVIIGIIAGGLVVIGIIITII